ncbi:MAG: cytochrome P450 [Pseudomonadota bacterium]
MALGIDPETLQTLEALRDEYGDIVAVEKPSGRLAYFINDPHEVRRILTRRHAKYSKGPGFERVKMLLGNGLIVSDGDVWRRSRTMIQPAFTRQAVHRLVDVMRDCAERRKVAWIAAVEDGRVLNINTETNDFALELILVSIFGDDCERIFAGDDNPFSFLSQDSARDLSVVIKARALRNYMLELVNARRASHTAYPFDFLGMYMNAEDKQGRKFDDRELLDELMNLIIAGFETSANTLAWVWHVLSDQPDVEARLLAEIAEAMPDAASVTAENLARMVYTQQVLEETLRRYPPVWLFTRRADEEDELDDFDVPAGTDIYLSPYILHHTERFYPEPQTFDPDRFLLENQPKKDRPYFPFSLGPRRCLGEYFSFLEMKIHLARLLPVFRMIRTTDEEPALELAINLRSKGDMFLKPELRSH